MTNITFKFWISFPENCICLYSLMNTLSYHIIHKPITLGFVEQHFLRAAWLAATQIATQELD